MSDGGDFGKNLVTRLSKLNFDKMTIDTSLAQKYLSGKKSSFYQPNATNKDYSVCVIDSYGNKIYLDKEPPKIKSTLNIDYGKFKEKREVAIKIVEAIERNAELFAQLDFIIRGTNPQDVKKFDIPILINSFKNNIYGKLSDFNIPVYNNDSPNIKMGNNSPLSTLKLAATIISHTSKRIDIIAGQNTAVLCCLFIELCREVGLEDAVFSFQIQEDLEISSGPLGRNGCIAAVTSKCDVDSAIAALVNSTSDYKYPWKTTRIIVQESVLDKFKSRLSEISSKDVPNEYDNLKKKAMDVLVYKDKIFLFDFLDLPSSLGSSKQIIYIEGYRTSKELLSLLLKYPSHYLSLWCNDLSLSEEINSNCEAQLIWVNDIADFQGSNLLDNFIYEPTFLYQLDLQKRECFNEWKKLNLDERKYRLQKHFKGKLNEFTFEWKPPCFIEIDKTRMIRRTAQPIDYSQILGTEIGDSGDTKVNESIIESLLLGNAVLTDMPTSLSPPHFPVFPSQENFSIKQGLQYKTIITHHGETFAN